MLVILDGRILEHPRSCPQCEGFQQNPLHVKLCNIFYLARMHVEQFSFFRNSVPYRKGTKKFLKFQIYFIGSRPLACSSHNVSIQPPLRNTPSLPHFSQVLYDKSSYLRITSIPPSGYVSI